MIAYRGWEPPQDHILVHLNQILLNDVNDSIVDRPSDDQPFDCTTFVWKF